MAANNASFRWSTFLGQSSFVSALFQAKWQARTIR